ncbi:MAG TPA: GNAT family N-acetyltransferase [Casimicrobiaceae bacterium]|nr:GNAT family N-acetyltransferase [Casimicrobiaceae bacterium]
MTGAILASVETTHGPSPVMLDADALRARRAELCALLKDAVQSGASVGYIEPLQPASLEAFWQRIEADVANGERHVLATIIDDRIVGSVQLALCMKTNQPHRADIQKLLVMRGHRGRGIAATLMRRVEQLALDLDRWLLILDTRTDSDADRLYQAWGWQTIGRVPQYAMDPDGTLADCTFYWKRLR